MLVPPSSLPRGVCRAKRSSLKEYSPIVALPSPSTVLRYPSWRWEGVCFRSSKASEAFPSATLPSHGEKGYLCRAGGKARSLLPQSYDTYRMID